MTKPSPSPRHSIQRLSLGLWLEYATLGWNLIGTPVMMCAAVQAGSAAFAGFGLDSLVEIFASLVVVWQLKGGAGGRERQALRLIGAAFFMLAAYVLAQSLWTLTSGSHPAPSRLGMAWLAATVVVMSFLAWGKRVVGRALGNLVLRT